MILDGKSSQEYPVNAGVPQCFILGPTLFPLSLTLFLQGGVGGGGQRFGPPVTLLLITFYLLVLFS